MRRICKLLFGLLLLCDLCSQARAQCGPDQNPIDPVAGYFVATDTNPSTQVYAANRAIMVGVADAGYVAWAAQVNNCAITFPTLASIYAYINQIAAGVDSQSPGFQSYATNSAVVTGSISGAVLTVTAITSGSLSNNNILSGGGGLTALAPYIIGQLTGAAGGTGTYSISAAASIGSETITVVGVQLTNPIGSFIVITPATSTNVVFPNMGLANSKPIGGRFRIINGSVGSATLAPIDSGGNTLSAPTNPNAYLDVVIKSFGGPYSFGFAWNIFAINNVPLSFSPLMPPFGGTGTLSSTQHGIAVGEGLTSQMAFVGPCATNQFVMGQTAADPICATPAQAQAALFQGLFYAVATGVNFNAGATDTAITINSPTGRWAVNGAFITNASASLSTATLGIFTGAGGTGQAIAATQAVTVTATAADTANNMQTLTIAASMAYNDATVQVRVVNPQGSAATGDVVLALRPMP